MDGSPKGARGAGESDSKTDSATGWDKGSQLGVEPSSPPGSLVTAPHGGQSPAQDSGTSAHPAGAFEHRGAGKVVQVCGLPVRVLGSDQGPDPRGA